MIARRPATVKRSSRRSETDIVELFSEDSRPRSETQYPHRRRINCVSDESVHSWGLARYKMLPQKQAPDKTRRSELLLNSAPLLVPRCSANSRPPICRKNSFTDVHQHTPTAPILRLFTLAESSRSTCVPRCPMTPSSSGWFHGTRSVRACVPTRKRGNDGSNLRRLAPDIREAILFLPRVERGRAPICPARLREIGLAPDWRKPRHGWGRALLQLEALFRGFQ